MKKHIIYDQVIGQIDRATCARTPREEVQRQVRLLMDEIVRANNMMLPDWEYKQVALQLLHDLPCAKPFAMQEGIPRH